MFTKKTVKDIDVAGKTILLHAELDTPLTSDGQAVASDFRIKSTLPTIQYLKAQGCKVVLISKLGRPDGKPDPRQSLRPVAAALSRLLNEDIIFVEDCIGDAVKHVVADMQPAQVIMLENLRFHPEEEANDTDFARTIAQDAGADYFVNDCFALAHRKEAGNDAITRILPSVAGLHLADEVDSITKAIENPEHPLMAIIGGAKISDKIEILNKFIEIADIVVIGGAMANTFLAAKDITIGKSKFEPGDVQLAKDIMRKAAEKARNGSFVLYIPQDGVVASSLDKTAKTRIVDWDAHVIADIENYPKTPSHNERIIADNEMILDIGPFSGAFIAGTIQLARTVIWNGTMGVTEVPALHGPIGPFAHGSQLIIDALAGEYGNRPFSLIGGGDTVGYLEQRGLTEVFDHVSTGGGASLELMAGRILPGVASLQDK
jgi:3-phosphoglycerate kinase